MVGVRIGRGSSLPRDRRLTPKGEPTSSIATPIRWVGVAVERTPPTGATSPVISSTARQALDFIDGVPEFGVPQAVRLRNASVSRGTGAGARPGLRLPMGRRRQRVNLKRERPGPGWGTSVSGPSGPSAGEGKSGHSSRRLALSARGWRSSRRSLIGALLRERSSRRTRAPRSE